MLKYTNDLRDNVNNLLCKLKDDGQEKLLISNPPSTSHDNTGQN